MARRELPPEIRRRLDAAMSALMGPLSAAMPKLDLEVPFTSILAPLPRAPKEGMQIGDRHYRSGQFIPHKEQRERILRAAEEGVNPSPAVPPVVPAGVAPAEKPTGEPAGEVEPAERLRELVKEVKVAAPIPQPAIPTQANMRPVTLPTPSQPAPTAPGAAPSPSASQPADTGLRQQMKALTDAWLAYSRGYQATRTGAVPQADAGTMPATVPGQPAAEFPRMPAPQVTPSIGTPPTAMPVMPEVPPPGQSPWSIGTPTTPEQERLQWQQRLQRPADMYGATARFFDSVGLHAIATPMMQLRGLKDTWSRFQNERALARAQKTGELPPGVKDLFTRPQISDPILSGGVAAPAVPADRQGVPVQTPTIGAGQELPIATPSGKDQGATPRYDQVVRSRWDVMRETFRQAPSHLGIPPIAARGGATPPPAFSQGEPPVRIRDVFPSQSQARDATRAATVGNPGIHPAQPALPGNPTHEVIHQRPAVLPTTTPAVGERLTRQLGGAFAGAGVGAGLPARMGGSTVGSVAGAGIDQAGVWRRLLDSIDQLRKVIEDDVKDRRQSGSGDAGGAKSDVPGKQTNAAGLGGKQSYVGEGGVVHAEKVDVMAGFRRQLGNVLGKSGN